MTQPTFNPGDIKYQATHPYDPSDPVRFGQVVETAKDAFKQEFTQFFTLAKYNNTSRLVDIPTIEKYAIGGGGTSSANLETTVNLIMSYADTPDKLPMIAITSASARERRLGLGGNQVGRVQYIPSVVNTERGPFNIRSGSQLAILTWPYGSDTFEGADVTQVSRLEFVDAHFVDPSHATLMEVVDAINSQALYYKASITHGGFLRLEPGGPLSGSVEPRYIEIAEGDTDCLDQLGFILGQSDKFTSRDNLPKNRYFIASDMTVNIDVISDDLNTKQELADLVYAYFTYYLEQRYFQLLGRSYFERGLDPEEWFHIVLNGQFSWSSETSVPRPGQEGYDRIYSVRGSVPILLIDYIDKRIVTPFGDRVVHLADSQLPSGDFAHLGEVENQGKLRF